MGNEIQCGPAMGKSKSRLPSNMFKVKNINEHGDIIWRGVVEVNKNDLVLHQKNGEPIRWPLKSLRRYGCDKGLFSFESGRRCTTGPGIYAFKCKYAEQLFQLVKSNTEEGAAEEAIANCQSQSDSQRDGAMRWLPPAHTQSMSGLFSQNGTIIRRQISSTQSTGPTSPRPSVNGSLSAPSVFNSAEDSTTIQYLNADQLQYNDHTHEQGQQSSSHSSPALPPQRVLSSQLTPITLNYARLNLNPDEDAVENTGEAPLVIEEENDTTQPELPHRAPVQVTDIDMIDVQKLTISRDENDNRTDVSMDKNNLVDVCSEEKRIVFQTLETGNRITNKDSSLVPSKSRSIEILSDNSDLPYMNISKEELANDAKENPRRRSVPLSPSRANQKLIGENVLLIPRKTCPSSLYTNLDTVGELLPHSTAPGATAGWSDLRTKQSSSGHSQFIFDWAINSQNYANLGTLEGRGAMNSSGHSHPVVLHAPPKGKLHYAQLDFEESTSKRSLSSSSLSSPPQTPSTPPNDSDSPGKRTESYAIIDHNKTAALAISQRKIGDDDMPGRRTRHDALPKKR